ncbi:MAG: hypothetical protein RBU28_07395 [Bacteroidales bacterium]|jgi:hypothetical protein|nr:hypothetical protein [Bacteroidales bacterium]
MKPNLLIIAGTGNKSGKTSAACRLISEFRDKGIVSVKITPHFHETTPGLVILREEPGFSVYRETNMDLPKDTSRMLKAGASAVFFAKVRDNNLMAAFSAILDFTDPALPVLCESPALAGQLEPGLLIIMKSSSENNQKNINQLLRLPHVELTLKDIYSDSVLPVLFRDGRWMSWKYGSVS